MKNAVTFLLINNMNYDVCIYVCFIALSLYPHSVRRKWPKHRTASELSAIVVHVYRGRSFTALTVS